MGSECNQDVPPGIMPSLIARLLWAAQEDNPAEVKVPPNTRAPRPSLALDAGTPGRFFVWPSGTWGEQMLPGGHFLSVSTAGLVG